MLDQNQIDLLVKEHIEQFLSEVTENFNDGEKKHFQNGFKAGFNFAKRIGDLEFPEIEID